MRRVVTLSILVAALVAGLCIPPAAAWPERVLITNDDGIDSPGIVALARAFSPLCEVWVAAPLDERSGSGSFATIGWDRPTVEVEERALGDGIRAYAVDGYPVDCVLFALRGPMRGVPPDLVVSGINTSPNLGPHWFGSGTVGAARMAAAVGIPALAVSGYDERTPGAEIPGAAWTAALARTDLVRDLPAGGYLTVSLPECPPDEVRGVKVTGRAPELLDFMTWYEPSEAVRPGSARQVWRAVRARDRAPAAEDQAAYRDRYIAVVPMTVDEVIAPAVAELQGRLDEFPAWPAGAAGAPRR